MDVDIRRFDEPITNPALHAAHNTFDNRMLFEEDPTFGTRSLDDTAARLSRQPADQDVTRWFILEDGAVVAVAELFNDVEDVANLHIGWVDLRVLPDHRRVGLGTRLLREVAEEASGSARSMLMGETMSTVPAGDEFAAAIGAEAGLEERVSQLLIEDLDLSLMDAWIEHGRAQRDRFELLWIEGRWPREMLEDVVALSHVMNDAPMGNLDFEDQAFTAIHITSEEDEVFDRGFTRITGAVRDRATGRMAGYTQLFINPSFPDLGQQGDTGVHEDFRGNRLGKWLKAEVARYLVAEHPEITRIRTGNANSNAPMLAINEAMGFRPHHSGTTWQMATAAVLES